MPSSSSVSAPFSLTSDLDSVDAENDDANEALEAFASETGSEIVGEGFTLEVSSEGGEFNFSSDFSPCPEPVGTTEISRNVSSI